MQNLDKLFFNGDWSASRGNEWLPVINPATETEIARVPAGTATDVDAAVAAAKAAFPAWSATTIEERKQLLVAIADGMQARFDELVDAVSSSMGCPAATAAWLQIEGPIEGMRLFADSLDQIEIEQTMGNSLVVREAVGVCGFINPWNYPLHQFVGKVGAALAAGCTMVVKPSEQTPLQDYLMAEIMADAGVPAGVFNLVPGRGQVVGSRLSQHPDVDMVSFTGSTRAGIEIAKAAAPSVKRVTQELGGKSPYIITPEADLAAAVRYGVEDVMLNSGQTCTALTRMLVHRSQYQQATEIAKGVAESLVVGTGEDAFLGPMSSSMQQQRVLEYIAKGQDEGARLLCGGKAQQVDGKGFYVEPTIFADVSNEMEIAREEIFGPVLCMIAYDSVEEAVEIANDTPYGLSSAVYADNEENALKLARQIRAGQCYMNGAQFSYHAPFGGYKQSGNGREFSVIGVEEFMEVKAIQRP
ncbi:aldehyde dehydrogenase family protein [Pseudomaricurvus alkylphenolicus]|uniref:aldehyde dehydrogenase family protein n=1 Tax=Pseudomaricurvus alkylphenolicus TaxID=1306991 RepID=UPI0014212A55|nr:aldehyde dehydrogenase family protein [Pseudomaricurvus alkylphenolicus]NIB39938.1 aldehyde dehydrogenase family protein [Pseudomaricurvus alkylphenolicus]